MKERFLYDFSKENLIKKLHLQINEQTNDIAVLKSVERKHKKDGSDFAYLLKNFTNLIYHDLDPYWLKANNAVNGNWVSVTLYTSKGDSPDDIWEAIQKTIRNKQADIEVRLELLHEIEDGRCGIINDLETIVERVKTLGEYNNHNEIDKCLYYLLYNYMT